MKSEFPDLKVIFIMFNATTKLTNDPKILMTKAAARKYDWNVNNLYIFLDLHIFKMERSCKLNKLIKIYALK